MKKNQMSKISMFALLIAACATGPVYSMRRVASNVMRTGNVVNITKRQKSTQYEIEPSKLGILGIVTFFLGMGSGYGVAKFQDYKRENSIEFLKQRIVELNEKLEKKQAENIDNTQAQLKKLQEQLAQEQANKAAWAERHQKENSNALQNPLDANLSEVKESEQVEQPVALTTTQESINN